MYSFDQKEYHLNGIPEMCRIGLGADGIFLGVNRKW